MPKNRHYLISNWSQIARSTIAICCTLTIFTGCSAQAIPPTAVSISGVQTQQVQTQIAPPPQYQQSVQFPRIDANLTAQPYWRAAITLSFDGVLTGTQSKTTGVITAEIYSNESSGERRVVLQTTGEAFGTNAPRYLEGVRIGNAFYRVDADRACTTVTADPSGRTLAELSAGALLGGVQNAVYATTRRIAEALNKTPVWEFSFSPDDVIPPAVTLADGGTITIASGGLWIAPAFDAVADYQITLNIVNGRIQGSSALTGQLRAEYHLLEVGTPYNIAIPYGC